VQGASDLDQVRGIGHHLVDDLVRRRDLVHQRCGVAVPDAGIVARRSSWLNVLRPVDREHARPAGIDHARPGTRIRIAENTFHRGLALATILD
jgi:hypothetical protein